ncbi:MAG: FeoB-associated Cys-rich membrane protein [Prevotella sp.]|nr:FeoB-associated Cys-rich membrane protein [Prevotella sp.]
MLRLFCFTISTHSITSNLTYPMTIQYIIIAAVLLACIVYIVHRIRKQTTGDDCSCGCSGCHKQCSKRVGDKPEDSART